MIIESLIIIKQSLIIIKQSFPDPRGPGLVQDSLATPVGPG